MWRLGGGSKKLCTDPSLFIRKNRSGNWWRIVIYCHMYWFTVKIDVSCALYRQSIPFIEQIGKKERPGCRM